MRLRPRETDSAGPTSVGDADLYRELFEDAPVGFLHLDRAGVIVEANAKAASILAAPVGSLVGRRITAFMSPTDAERLDAHCMAALADGQRLVHELRLRAENGRWIPVRMEATGIHGRASGKIRCRCALIDLSDVEHARSELAEGERRLKEIAERVEAVLYIHDEHGTITYVNPAFERIWGRPAAELYQDGETWLNAVHREDEARVRGAFARLLRGEDFDEEYRIVRPDGEVRWVLDRASPLDVNPSVFRIGGLVYDITERREGEAALRHAQKMEAIGTLASGIAHDFNNVLQAIVGSAEAARRPNLSSERRHEYLDRIRAIAKRGGGLARRLLVFSRAHEPKIISISIDDAVASSSDLIRRLTGEHIDVAVRLGAPDGIILIDPVELDQILMNLASNARDAMPTGGALSIRTEIARLSPEEAERHHPLARPGEYVRITVEDTGLGMDEETRTRAFDPFFTTKDAGKGTGLGLSTVFAIVKRSGGHVDLQSQPGKGTQVALCFPRSDRPAARLARQQGPRSAVRGTVLLVEDDPDIRASLRVWLEELGLRVLTADGFERALRIRDRGESIDLVVADVRMSGMQGPELVAQVRAAHPNVRVLYVSADARPELIALGILSESDVHLQKPFDREDLEARVEALWRTHVNADGASPHTIVIVEDDTNARLALRELLMDRGYRVLAFARPSELLDVARLSPTQIDLLITDLCLPEMEGTELVRRLRATDPSLPVVFMSGRADPPAMEAAAYLQKPIDIDDLARHVEAALH